MEELKEHQENEAHKLLEKLEREAKEEEERRIREFETYRIRTINEARNTQAAELSSRNEMGTEESQRVGWFFYYNRLSVSTAKITINRSFVSRFKILINPTKFSIQRWIEKYILFCAL